MLIHSAGSLSSMLTVIEPDWAVCAQQLSYYIQVDSWHIHLNYTITTARPSIWIDHCLEYLNLFSYFQTVRMFHFFNFPRTSIFRIRRLRYSQTRIRMIWLFSSIIYQTALLMRPFWYLGTQHTQQWIGSLLMKICALILKFFCHISSPD